MVFSVRPRQDNDGPDGSDDGDDSGGKHKGGNPTKSSSSSHPSMSTNASGSVSILFFWKDLVVTR
jgi:hypothetical protein